MASQEFPLSPNSASRNAASDPRVSAEQRLHQLFDSFPLASVLLDAEGQIRQVNASLGDVLGYAGRDLIGGSFLRLIVPEDIPDVWLRLRSVIAGAEHQFRMERRFLRRDGKVIWGRIVAFRLGEAANSTAMVMVEDVTAERESHTQLEHSRRRMAHALEASRMVAWEIDPETGVMSWVDRNTLRNGGTTPRSEPYRDVFEHVHAEDREDLHRLTETVIREGGEFHSEFRMLARDNSVRWMLCKGELLAGSPGTPARVVGVTVDVSALKRAHRELQRLAERLMGAQEEERKRISRELHDDIGQRMALFSVELDLLRQRTDDPALLQRIARLQGNAEELCSDLHAISHALNCTKLKHLGLPAALRELAGRLGQTPLQLTITCPAEKPMLSEEEALVLYRVAQESLNNVLRHSAATAAALVLSVANGRLSLVITDNGVGFEMERGSAGIGLVGMKERLRAVAGELQITSAPGAGTEVRASIPYHGRGETSVKVAAATAGD